LLIEISISHFVLLSGKTMTGQRENKGNVNTQSLLRKNFA